MYMCTVHTILWVSTLYIHTVLWVSTYNYYIIHYSDIHYYYYVLLEVHALLMTDILVLLSKAEDGSERLFLKMYHVEGINGVRDEISPVIRLKDLLFRDRADRGRHTHNYIG